MNDTAGLRLTVRAAEAGRGPGHRPAPNPPESGSASSAATPSRSAVSAPRSRRCGPAGGTPEGSVLIDADTRANAANAGVKVGDAVTAAAAVDVEDADRIVLAAPAELADVDVSREVVERALARDLRDRPVTEGEAVHVERLGGIRFVVAETDPAGTVRVTSRTDVSVRYGDEDASRSDAGAGGIAGLPPDLRRGAVPRPTDPSAPTPPAPTPPATPPEPTPARPAAPEPRRNTPRARPTRTSAGSTRNWS